MRVKNLWKYLLLVSLSARMLFSQDAAPLETPPAELAGEPVAFSLFKSKDQEGYTINYTTVPIIEYLQFASKICKVNFIYDELDLNFTITVVSDEPVTAQNVMATLVQVLRIHGLMLLEQDNNLVIHKDSGVKQIAKLVTESSQQGNAPIVTRIFRVKNTRPESIAAIVQPMISTSALLEVSPETRQLIITDVTANIDKIADLIENLDSPHTTLEIKKYLAHHNPPQYLVQIGAQIMTPIVQGVPFIVVPQDLSHEIFIVSTPELTAKAIEVFASLDVEPKERFGKRLKTEDVFVYKAVHRSGSDILKGLANIAEYLKETDASDTGLIDTVESAKWIRETNSILLVGTKASVDKAKEFVISLDTPGEAFAPKVSFFIYKPQYRNAEDTRRALVEMADNLRSTKGISESLLETIQNCKVNPLTHTLSFTGPEEDFPRIKELLATIDNASAKPTSPIAPSTQFLIYKPVYRTGEQLSASLKDLAAQLKNDRLADPGLLHALNSMKWVDSTQSLLFTGDPDSLKKVQALIATVDAPDVATRAQPSYYIYKVQHTSGEFIEEDLDNVAKNLRASGVKGSALIEVIENMRYVKQTNSLVLSGDPRGIEEAKQLIAQYDYPRHKTPAPANNFFMYKPVSVPAKQLEKDLRDLQMSLQSAGLADPNLLQTLETVKYVESTNTLIFTGTADTLTKIQGMVKEIDVPSASQKIQHIGKTTFLLYKLKHAGGAQIISSIQHMATELKKSGTSDKDLLATLSSVKYVKETNSLLFTGTPEALTRAQTLVEQFDVPGLGVPKGAAVANAYYVYRPQALAGPELEQRLNNFAASLQSGGFTDPDLFNTIHSMRWTDQALVFTGTTKSIDQIKELLKEFDVPVAGLGGESIQAIDNTSFLVYKLQFHKGDEIQNALRQIAKDLITTNAPINQNLLNSINSIQWLEVTNSLLCSGDTETLTRLRELVKNLDIPLKQVFIEMLVVETTLTNALQFGLEWGGNYKYLNKFGAGTYNSQPFTTGTPSTWLQNLSGFAPPSVPNPVGKIPVSSGFDLGVIGEVIRHNGQSFLTLGSLLSALQQDEESSIIMTPKILTQDGRTSTIFDGRNIPFVGSFVQNNGANTVNTSNIEYRDIGLNLTITPVLGNSDIVTLDIQLERTQTVGDASGTTNFTSQSAAGITTTKTTMNTTVHVPDNNFLILSGMVNNSNTKSKAAIPCLGGLPLIGAAFTKNNDTIVNSNIVIFIRPHIINSVDEIRHITREEEDYFRDQSGTPFLEKGFDEAMELIKTVDDE